MEKRTVLDRSAAERRRLRGEVGLAAVALPGRTRGRVADAEGWRVFLAIREPSMVLVAALPGFDALQRWPLRA